MLQRNPQRKLLYTESQAVKRSMSDLFLLHEALLRTKSDSSSYTCVFLKIKVSTVTSIVTCVWELLLADTLFIWKPVVFQNCLRESTKLYLRSCQTLVIRVERIIMVFSLFPQEGRQHHLWLRVQALGFVGTGWKFWFYHLSPVTPCASQWS